jgi:hypothetical protein
MLDRLAILNMTLVPFHQLKELSCLRLCAESQQKSRIPFHERALRFEVQTHLMDAPWGSERLAQPAADRMIRRVVLINWPLSSTAVASIGSEFQLQKFLKDNSQFSAQLLR